MTERGVGTSLLDCMDTQTRSRIDVMPHLHSLISLIPLISYFRLRLTLWHLNFKIHATVTFFIHATITRSRLPVRSPSCFTLPLCGIFGGIFPGLFILSARWGFCKALNPRLALD